MGLMLAMALLAQVAAGAPPPGGGSGFRDMSGEGPNAFPERWRYDLTAAVPRLVRDTASAEIAPPLSVTIGGTKRYIACIRVEGPTRLDPSPGTHEYVALFDSGGMTGMEAATPGACDDANYLPFAEARAP